MVKKILHVEYGVAFLFVLMIYIKFDFSLWVFILLLFVPDVTMVGYLRNAQIGAVVYNLGHNLILPIMCTTFCLYVSNETGLMLAMIWLAHILMDRFLGYGLKYSQSFQETHMQRV